MFLNCNNIIDTGVWILTCAPLLISCSLPPLPSSLPRPAFDIANYLWAHAKLKKLHVRINSRLLQSLLERLLLLLETQDITVQVCTMIAVQLKR